MKHQYYRSICSTCSYLSLCSLTRDKSNIHCCSEYEHYLQHSQEKNNARKLLLQHTPNENNRQLVLK
ncbi:hypothetical protein ES765_02580 [Maribacter sp. ACAM166]|nr:hypothetical protein ES765_02580 [Maribacter sp. ACAM166]